LQRQPIGPFKSAATAAAFFKLELAAKNDEWRVGTRSLRQQTYLLLSSGRCN
jgi:hypothetical protein